MKHGEMKPKTEEALVPAATCQATARGAAARGHGRTCATPTDVDSASDPRRQGGTGVHARREVVGYVRRRITGKRRRPEAALSPHALTTTSDDQLTLRGCDAAGTDKGIVGRTNSPPPSDVLPCGNDGKGAEQGPAHRVLRRRVTISVGDTRIAECRDVQGTGEARRGAAEDGEMNTEKFTLSCPSKLAHSDDELHLRATVSGLGDRADHAVGEGAAAVLFSAVAVTRGSPPESAG